MKKAISLFSAFALLIFFSAFKQDEQTIPSKSAKVNQDNLKFATSEVTLLVECLSNRTQPLGSSFQHKVKLMNGTNPIANAEVKINDPIGRVCTWVTTNSKGEAVWTRSIPLSTKQQAYAIEFFYGSVKYYSTVAVTLPSDAINLPSYSINLNSAGSLDNNTLVMASRGGFASTQQAINTTLKEAAQFGVAVAKDYLNNPFNIMTATVAAVSCTVGQSFLGVGQAACITSLIMVKSGLTSSTIKILGNKLIDASNFLEADKTNLKNMLELSTIAYSVATLNPAEGLSKLVALGAGYDFIKNAYGQLVYVNGELKGASFPAQKKGSSEVYMMCLYNREAPNQIASQTSKDPNCKENNTGDYCFQNNTNLDLKVTLMSSPSKIFSYTSPFTCTLQPGQKQCFFDVPAGAARYDINNNGIINGYDSTTNIKQYNAEGSLYVDKCQENTFFINLETPSYSSNIPAQTNENKIQTSKDPNCKENNTGDYCFQNNTELDLKVTLMSSPSKIFSYTSPFTCTLQPGQKQCFFDVPAGAARYDINNNGIINGYGSTTIIKQYNAEGSLYVDPCLGITFIIK